MNIRAFRAMWMKDRVKYLSKLLDADGGKSLDFMRGQLFGSGHTEIAHGGLSPRTMVDRIIAENHSVSAFENQEEAVNFVECLLFDEKILSQIAGWLCKREPTPLSISFDMGETVGVGINKNFYEKTTEVLTVALYKTRDPENQFGFYVKTAYPDIDHEKAQYTGRNFKHLIPDALNRNTDELCRARLGLQLNGFTNVSRSFTNAEEALNVFFMHNDEQYILQYSKYYNPRVLHVDADQNVVRYNSLNHKNFPEDVATNIAAANEIYEKFAFHYDELVKDEMFVNDNISNDQDFSDIFH